MKGEFLTKVENCGTLLTVRTSFGWVNASYVYGLSFIPMHMKRALGTITPYETFARATEIKLGADETITEVQMSQFRDLPTRLKQSSALERKNEFPPTGISSGNCGRIFHPQIIDIDIALDANRRQIYRGPTGRMAMVFYHSSAIKLSLCRFRCCLAQYCIEHFFFFTACSMATSERSYGVVAAGMHCK